MPANDATTENRLYLLDVGWEQYGDCILCCFGSKTILVDGGHPGDEEDHGDYPSIPQQLAEILGHQPPFRVSLLVVTHAHADHVGCLPALVNKRLLKADWALVADPGLAGYADSAGGGGVSDAFQDASPAARRLIAGLLEEDHTDLRDDIALDSFLDDAWETEVEYPPLLKALEKGGTRVVRYGRDSHTKLVNAFKDVGLQILGPSENQLQLCADLIRQEMDSLATRLEDLMARDSAFDGAAAYRSLLLGTRGADATSRLMSKLRNAQSIILSLQVGNNKVLLTGDAQLASPEVSDLEDEVETLRQVVVGEGPYAFVKLPHHGSANGFNEALLNAMEGSSHFGISTGFSGEDHPSRKVLSLLKKHAATVQWARTDRNGLITVDLGAHKVKVTPSRNELNDATPKPKASDEGLPPVGPISAAEAMPRTGVALAAGRPGMVEVIARLPHVRTRVALTIEVQPAADIKAGRIGQGIPPASPEETSRSTTTADPGTARSASLHIAAGRKLPKLLFVTCQESLADNVGQSEAAQVLSELRACGHAVYDKLPVGIRDAAQAAQMVRPQITSDINGVVLLGGPTIVPSQRVDALDPRTRAALSSAELADDTDNYIVWSDEVYVDTDMDGDPELPVSRIPDGRAGRLLLAAIQADAPSEPTRFGLRNVARPFAQEVFAGVPDQAQLNGMLVSKPTRPHTVPARALGAEHIYLMLHGAHDDGTQFWGEDGAGHFIDALNTENIVPNPGSVVFTGCCYGALCADKPAVLAVPTRPTGARTPESSIALSFLQAGAVAFVGCTGVHYSPNGEKPSYFGGPMHVAFWQSYCRNRQPAKALFEAKIEYLKGIPHGQDSAVGRAIELKILRQYTCLGLGW